MKSVDRLNQRSDSLKAADTDLSTRRRTKTRWLMCFCFILQPWLLLQDQMKNTSTTHWTSTSLEWVDSEKQRNIAGNIFFLIKKKKRGKKTSCKSQMYSHIDYWFVWTKKIPKKKSFALDSVHLMTSTSLFMLQAQPGVWGVGYDEALSPFVFLTCCRQHLKGRKVAWRRTSVLIPKRQYLTKALRVGWALLTGDTSSLSLCPLERRRWTNPQPFCPLSPWGANWEQTASSSVLL